MGALRRAHPFLDHAGPIAFAHRGGAADHPENTMAAFEAAVGLGYRYLETDVRATADGVLVVFHDERLDRVTDRSGRIGERTWAELADARVGTAGAVVRLEDLFDAFPRARLNVDPKSDAAVAPLLALLARSGLAERTCVGSFSTARVEAVRDALGDRGCTAATPREVMTMRAASWGARWLVAGLRTTRADCLQVPRRVAGLGVADARMIRLAHELGLPVHVWTVDDPAEMERLLDLGVDGLMSDRPGVLRSVLERRGAWRPA